jgi:hypothetical protein
MQLKKLYIILGLQIWVMVGWTQNKVTDTSATVVAYWKKGEKAQLSFNQTKKQFEKNQLKTTNTLKSVIDVCILDSTEKGYKISWTYTKVTAKNEKENLFAQKISKLSEGLVVIYTTNELGAFKELINWRDVQKYVYKAADAIEKEFKNTPYTEPLKQVRKLYASKETIEQIVIKEVQLYHSVYGEEYILKNKLVGDAEQPNFLGGDPFPATITVEMTELRPKDDYCKIQLLQTLDQEKVTKIMNDWAKKIDPVKSSKPVISNLVIEDVSEFEAQLSTGWITNAMYKRTLNVDYTKVIEINELKKL